MLKPTQPMPHHDWMAYTDGQFMPLSAIQFMPNTQALNYGTGVFEGIRAYKSFIDEQLYLFRAQDHYARLIASSRTLKMELDLSVSDLVAITQQLIRCNQFNSDIYIRPLVLKKHLLPGSKFGVKLSGVSSTLCINALPMGRYVQPQVDCIISKWRRVSNQAIPSGAKITGTYVNSALAYEDALDQGFDDAIMLNEQGYCTEATTSNLFIIDAQGCVLTPALSAGILNGITRQSILSICEALQIPARQQMLTPEDLLQAKAAFLVGTGVEVVAIARIDDHRFDDASAHALLERITQVFLDITRGQSTLFPQWLTAV